MDKFDCMRTFTRVVEEGGFSAAARKMGRSRSIVNKQVIHLEQSLGIQLLNRSTRRVATTETGLAYYHRCLAILGDLEEAELAASRLEEEPRGMLRVNAPMSFGTIHLGPAIAEFMTRYPELTVELTLTDRMVDTMREGFDITVRISEPPTASGLTVQTVAKANRVLCASPEYLKAHGTPSIPEELRGHRCLHYGNLAGGNLWRLAREGREHTVRVQGTFCANNAEALRDAALRHLGIVILPTFVTGPDITNGDLIPILKDYGLPEVFIFIMYPPNRHLSAKTRLFTAFMEESFGSRRDWDLAPGPDIA